MGHEIFFKIPTRLVETKYVTDLILLIEPEQARSTVCVLASYYIQTSTWKEKS
jgi:hypothetical protein